LSNVGKSYQIGKFYFDEDCRYVFLPTPGGFVSVVAIELRQLIHILKPNSSTKLKCRTSSHHVSGSPFLFVCLLVVHFGLSRCVGKQALLHFFVWLCALEKMQMCLL